MTVIRLVLPAEHVARRAIEREAGRAFAATGMEAIAAAEPLAVADLEVCRAAGGAWVAVDAWDRPVACPLSSIIDGCGATSSR